MRGPSAVHCPYALGIQICPQEALVREVTFDSVHYVNKSAACLQDKQFKLMRREIGPYLFAFTAARDLQSHMMYQYLLQNWPRIEVLVFCMASIRLKFRV